MSGANRATFVISLDFELYWGVRDKRSLASYQENLRGSREVIPWIIDRFVHHGVHATWATVGMLFCETKEELIASLPARKPRYRHAGLSPYPDLGDVGADERTDPFHFAPSLVGLIASAPGQELATHTFSHYYCLEPGQSAEDFGADLDAAVAVAARKGVALRSIVFPRNEVNSDYLDLCVERGLVAFRGTPHAWMHRARSASSETAPRRLGRLVDAYMPVARSHHPAAITSPSGMVDIPASRFFRPRSKRLRMVEGRKIRRILGEMRHAATYGLNYHLWWHPHNFGVEQPEHMAQLEQILEGFAELRDQGLMRSRGMGELADEARG